MFFCSFTSSVPSCVASGGVAGGASGSGSVEDGGVGFDGRGRDGVGVGGGGTIAVYEERGGVILGFIGSGALN